MNYIQETNPMLCTSCLDKPSPVPRIVSNKHWIRRNERQFFNVHKQSLQILPRDGGQINNVVLACVDPKVIRIHSFETVPAEGTRLRPRAPDLADRR